MKPYHTSEKSFSSKLVSSQHCSILPTGSGVCSPDLSSKCKYTHCTASTNQKFKKKN